MINFNLQTLNYIFSLCLIVLLSGCSDLSDVGNQKDTAPVADAAVIGAVLTTGGGTKVYSVRAGSEVLLSGKDSEGYDDPILQFNWKQIDSSDINVTLVERTRNSRVFRVPDVIETTELKIQLTVVDADGRSATDIVTIRVEPASDNDRFLQFPLSTSNKYTVIPVLKNGYSVTEAMELTVERRVLVNYADRNSTDGEANRPVELEVGETLTKSTTFPQIESVEWQSTQAAKLHYEFPHFSFVYPNVDIDDINTLFEVNNRDKLLDLFALNSLSSYTNHVLVFNEGVCTDTLNEIIACEDAFQLLTLNVNEKIIDFDNGISSTISFELLGDDNPEDITQQAFETKDSALAYYAAVDPDDRRTTLSDWLVNAGFTDASGNSILQEDQYAKGLYLNNYDLGFGREMYIRVDETTGNVYSYVLNYPGLEASLKKLKPLATVAMEFSPPDQDASQPQFVKFFTFVPDELGDQTRVLTFNFDGRGEKTVPSVCLSCHGGRPKPLNEDGTYPDNGDVNGSFMPWDLDSFLYTKAIDPKQVDPDVNSNEFSAEQLDLYSRASQEAQLRAMNEAALATYVVEPDRFKETKELIHGWYGSDDVESLSLPENDFDGSYVLKGWEGQETLYHEGFAQYCRACHMQGYGTERFGDFEKFEKVKDKIQSLVFAEGLMPLARLTADRFWVSYHGETSAASAFADYFELDSSEQKPGTPVIRITGGDIITALSSSSREALLSDGQLSPSSPILNQETVRVDASSSLNTDAYSWSITTKPENSQAELIGATTATPSFKVDQPGEYRLSVFGTNTIGSSEPVEILVDAEPLNPKQEVAGPASLMENGTLNIDSSILKFSDIDSDASEIVFTITVAPEHGQILLEGSLQTQFTQQDIDDNKVTYQHDGAEFASDSFRFIVTDDTNETESEESFLFSLSVLATNDEPLLTMNEVFSAGEGQSAPIQASNLTYSDADHAADEVIYTLLTAPANGEARLNNFALDTAVFSRFTQLNINQGELTYLHDGTETTSDSFTYSVADITGAVGSAGSEFNISVTSVADTPTVVLEAVSVTTGRSTSLSGAVIAGTAPNGNRSESIQVFDDDSAAVDISLRVTTLPSEGSLELDGVTVDTSTMFTMADVVANLLVYSSSQDVSATNPVADTFRFEVLNAGLPVLDLQGSELIDGSGVGDIVLEITTTAATDGPVITASTITLSGLSILTNNAIETWGSGATGNSVTVTNVMINVEDSDNTAASGFTYTLTSLPSTGTLALSGTELSISDTFTQQNINNGELVFTNTLSATALQVSDSFDIDVIDNESITAAKSITITKQVALANDVRKVFKLLVADGVTSCSDCHSPSNGCGIGALDAPCWLNGDGTVNSSNLSDLSPVTNLYLYPSSDNHGGGNLMSNGDLHYEILEACVNGGCF
mgnify:CR=1 FL=1